MRGGERIGGSRGQSRLRRESVELVESRMMMSVGVVMRSAVARRRRQMRGGRSVVERVEQHRVGVRRRGVMMRDRGVALSGGAERRGCRGGIHAGGGGVMRGGGSGAGEGVQGARQAVIARGSEEKVSRRRGVAVSVMMTHVAVCGGGGGVGRVKGRLVAALGRLGGGHVMRRGEFEGAVGKMGGGGGVRRGFHEWINHRRGEEGRRGGGSRHNLERLGGGCVGEVEIFILKYVVSGVGMFRRRPLKNDSLGCGYF